MNPKVISKKVKATVLYILCNNDISIFSKYCYYLRNRSLLQFSFWLIKIIFINFYTKNIVS